MQPSNRKFKAHHARGFRIATHCTCKECLLLNEHNCLNIVIDNHLNLKQASLISLKFPIYSHTTIQGEKKRLHFSNQELCNIEFQMQ